MFSGDRKGALRTNRLIKVILEWPSGNLRLRNKQITFLFCIQLNVQSLSLSYYIYHQHRDISLCHQLHKLEMFQNDNCHEKTERFYDLKGSKANSIVWTRLTLSNMSSSNFGKNPLRSWISLCHNGVWKSQQLFSIECH